MQAVRESNRDRLGASRRRRSPVPPAVVLVWQNEVAMHLLHESIHLDGTERRG